MVTRKEPATVSLSQNEKDFKLKEELARGEADLRKDFAKKMLHLFYISNAGVMFFLAVLIGGDYCFLGAKILQPGERVINSNVVMTLLGATTVQLATIMFSITGHLFPKKSRG